jgi:hypothetical protein
VAPRGQPQSDLVLGKLSDALKDDQAAKDLENRTGLTREQLEQFAKKYEKPKSGPVEPGRQIEVKPGEATPAKPGENLPGFDKTQRMDSKSIRERGTMPQDTVRNMQQGISFEPPPEWRGKVAGYKSKLARSQVMPTRRAAPAPAPAAGGK